MRETRICIIFFRLAIEKKIYVSRDMLIVKRVRKTKKTPIRSVGFAYFRSFLSKLLFYFTLYVYITGHSLSFLVAETYGEESTSILETAELWKKNISAFIGPQETCLHEARMAAAFNLPMISYVSQYKNSNI